jgi:hypothetical protein
MSPRLIFLLTAQRIHHPLASERDEIDAELAAIRTGIARPTPAPFELLLAA